MICELKKRQSTKIAKPAPTTQHPVKSSHHRQPPAPTPAPATPAPVPTDTRQPCPETLPPLVAAGRVGVQQTSLPASPFRQPAKPATPAATPTKHCSLSTPTPTPAAKRPALRLIPLQEKMTTPSYSDASLQLQSTTRR